MSTTQLLAPLAITTLVIAVYAWLAKHLTRVRGIRLNGLHDSLDSLAAKTPLIEIGPRPRTPTPFMITSGIKVIEEAGQSEQPPTDVLVQLVWTEMWEAWEEEMMTERHQPPLCK